MSASQYNALHSALAEGLASVKASGQFQAIALADEHGLAWGADGSLPAPDHFAAIPSLLARAFADRQPLLRFFSEKAMRFEYRSDSLAYIKRGIQGVPADAAYQLDVPGDKEATSANEFVVRWDDSYLVMRQIPVRGETWCLLGITPNANQGRSALAKAAPGLSSMLSAAANGSSASTQSHRVSEGIRGRLLEAMECFRASAPDTLMAAVTSKDGFVVAALDGAQDAEIVAPLMGHSFLAIQESTQQLCGATESAMLRMENGILLSREVADDLLFAALLAPTACTGLVVSAFASAAASLRSALESLPAAIAAPSAQEVAA